MDFTLFCPIRPTSIFTYPEDLSMMTLVCLESNTSLSLLLFVTPKDFLGALIFLSLTPLYPNPFVSKCFPCCGILLTYLPTDLLTYLLTNLLTHLLTVLLMDVPTYLRTYLPTDWLTDLFTYLLTDLLTNLFTYLFTYALTYCIECLSSPSYFRSPQVS